MFSVIIPFWKTDFKLFNECLKSVSNAMKFSDEEIELVFINDGNSEEKTYKYNEIISNYFNDIPHKLVKNVENFGIGMCRKIGFDTSENPWICYIDSDDTIESEYFDVLGNYINNKRNNDINFILHERNFINEESVLKINLSEYFNNNYLQNNITDHRFTPFWSKCFNRNFLEKIDIGKERIYEDILVWLQCVEKCNKFEIIPDKIYNYKPNENGVSETVFKNFYILNTLYEALQMIDKNPTKLGKFMNYLVSILKLEKEFILKPEIYKSMMTILNEILLSFEDIKNEYLIKENKEWLKTEMKK